MAKYAEVRTTAWKVSGVPHTVALPAVGGTATEIDCTADQIVAVALTFQAAIHWTFAADAATAVTQFAAAQYEDTRGSGRVQIDVSNETRKLYVRAAGAAVALGLSWTLIEGV